MDGAMKTDKRELRAWQGGKKGREERRGGKETEGESKNFAQDVIRLEAIQFVVTVAFYGDNVEFTFGF